jgi:hypothetical protein
MSSTSNVPTTIYSLLPAEAFDPIEIVQAARGVQDRSVQSLTPDDYSPLPWPLEALPGTTWRNIISDASALDHAKATRVTKETS